MAELATGGISSFIHEKLREHYKLIDSPFLDATGVILVIYYFYKKYKTEVKKEPIKLFNSHILVKENVK